MFSPLYIDTVRYCLQLPLEFQFSPHVIHLPVIRHQNFIILTILISHPPFNLWRNWSQKLHSYSPLFTLHMTSLSGRQVLPGRLSGWLSPRLSSQLDRGEIVNQSQNGLYYINLRELHELHQTLEALSLISIFCN